MYRRFASLVLLALLIFAHVFPARANDVAGMRVIGDTQRTRFVVDLDKNPEYGILRLANPYRLVIDLPDAVFPEALAAGEGRGLISDFRYGLIAPGKARIVLDLVGPVDIVNSFVLDPMAPEPARLVVDLVPATAPEFAAAVAADRAKLEAIDASQARRDVVPSDRPVVVIDPRPRRHRFRRRRKGRVAGEGRHPEIREGAGPRTRGSGPPVSCPDTV